ncbi:T9SS type A sorting domain-containing protein [Chitinophagaceae bacterium MMS25-I14]
MRKFIFSIAVLFGSSLSAVQAQVKILFDNTKAETAGNADWIIDADNHNLNWNPNGYTSSSGHGSNAQRTPTPAQSSISASTPETYWTGALSNWGIDCVNQGYEVETLPYNGSITYGNSSNTQDLSNYKVFIICEPNIIFSAAEKTALMQFVQHGGGLFIVSDHDQSDRNGDGYDSPTIWNDFMNNNSVQSNPFGISFDLLDFSGTYSNISAIASDSIIHGSYGTVTQVKWSGGTSMTLDPAKNATVKGVIYKTGATAGGNTSVLTAYARYGNGKVVAIGDSSPCDDGTGNPNTTLYNGYTQDANGNHRKLLMNATIWLATTDSTNTTHTGVQNITGNDQLHIYPNPSQGAVNITSDDFTGPVKITVFSTDGKIILQQENITLKPSAPASFQLNSGFYFVQVSGETISATSKLIIF